jgi:hypothetical protein
MVCVLSVDLTVYPRVFRDVDNSVTPDTKFCWLQGDLGYAHLLITRPVDRKVITGYQVC